MKGARLTGLLWLLTASAPALAQPTVRDTTVVLERDGQSSRTDAAGKVLAVRLESVQARVVAGASYRVLRLRLSWQGATGAIRVHAHVAPEIQRLFSPSSQPPR